VPQRFFGFAASSYGLAQRSALTDCDGVAFFNTESRGHVRGQVLVSLLISGVLGNEVEVFSSDDQGSVHLGGNDFASEDTASDGNHAGERAFLVCRKMRIVRFRSIQLLKPEQVLHSAIAASEPNGHMTAR
jgi:hypothetical protein